MHIAQTWFFQGRAKIAEPLGRGILVLLIQFHLGNFSSATELREEMNNLQADTTKEA